MRAFTASNRTSTASKRAFISPRSPPIFRHAERTGDAGEHGGDECHRAEEDGGHESDHGHTCGSVTVIISSFWPERRSPGWSGIDIKRLESG